MRPDARPELLPAGPLSLEPQPLEALPLGDGYQARRVPYAEYLRVMKAFENQVFGDNWEYDFGPARRPAPPVGEALCWLIERQGEPVGWSLALERDERTVYMADTGLLPEHQGRGLYGRLLPGLLDAFREAGYAVVQSHHRATNNRVIIPKLRRGFFVQGLNLYAGGLNVALTCPLDGPYAEAMHARSGWRAPGPEAAARLGVRPRLEGGQEGSDPAPPTPPVPWPADASPTGEVTDLGGGYTLWPVPYAVAEAAAQAHDAAAYQTLTFDWPAPAPFDPPAGQRHAWLIGFTDPGGVGGGGSGGAPHELAGWQLSRQWDRRTAYMANTALLAPHRGRGVYTRLLPTVLGTFEQAGYQTVRSQHHATNSAVLIPKLRAGFLIQGLEVTHHGVMATLLRPLVPQYAAALHLRSGLIRPALAPEAAARLGLPPQEADAGGAGGEG